MLMDRNPWLVRVLKAVIGDGLLRLNQKSKQTTYEIYETASLPLLNWSHNASSEHWTVLARHGTMEKLSIWLKLEYRSLEPADNAFESDNEISRGPWYTNTAWRIYVALPEVKEWSFLTMILSQ